MEYTTGLIIINNRTLFILHFNPVHRYQSAWTAYFSIVNGHESSNFEWCTVTRRKQISWKSLREQQKGYPVMKPEAKWYSVIRHTLPYLPLTHPNKRLTLLLCDHTLRPRHVFQRTRSAVTVSCALLYSKLWVLKNPTVYSFDCYMFNYTFWQIRLTCRTKVTNWLVVSDLSKSNCDEMQVKPMTNILPDTTVSSIFRLLMELIRLWVLNSSMHSIKPRTGLWFVQNNIADQTGQNIWTLHYCHLPFALWN